MAERLKPLFALCAAPLRVFKKREKTEDELFEEELAREEKEKRAKEYADLKRLAEETGEEVDLTGYEEFAEAENKKSVLRFLSPILYLKLLLRGGKAVLSLAFAPLLLLKRKRGEDEENWEDSENLEESNDQAKSDKSKNADAKTVADESADGDESDEETDEFEGRNWMRVAKKTIGVAIVASLALTVGYVGLLFFSGKHVGPKAEAPGAVALEAASGETASDKGEKAEKSGGVFARARGLFGGGSTK